MFGLVNRVMNNNKEIILLQEEKDSLEKKKQQLEEEKNNLDKIRAEIQISRTNLVTQKQALDEQIVQLAQECELTADEKMQLSLNSKT